MTDVPVHVHTLTVGVLALQGAFSEHIQLLRKAAGLIPANGKNVKWCFNEVRKAVELDRCDGLIIPGGESTTISLIAARDGLLTKLREFVKLKRKPTWGTCAGLILLAESANRTKKGGQELIGGLDVRVNRNHFGRQTESFTQDIELPFLDPAEDGSNRAFQAVFIRAPVVEKVLSHADVKELVKADRGQIVVALPIGAEKQISGCFPDVKAAVEIMARLPSKIIQGENSEGADEDADVVAVRQGNCFGTSFHPELTGDARIHIWWLGEVVKSLG